MAGEMIVFKLTIIVGVVACVDGDASQFPGITTHQMYVLTVPAERAVSRPPSCASIMPFCHIATLVGE